MATTTALEKSQERRPRRWDPFDLVDEVRDELARFWGEPWPLMLGRPLRRLKTATSWHPRVDMYEKDNYLVVKADLPGLKRDDIQVLLDNGDLIIKGESKTESEIKEEEYYYLERSAGSFYRRLTPPFEIKPDKIDASFKDGVLEIKIPKPAEKKIEAQKIAVH